MKMDFKLNGTSIKTPDLPFKTELYKVSKAERVASGKMMMDIIALKRKFYFTYSAITAAELNVILDILFTMSSMYTLTYIENNQFKSATVYVGGISESVFRTDDANWVWTDVSFDLIEQ